MKRRFQVFKSSGVFTPSDELLAAGGVVRVVMIGGGGGGTASLPGNGAVPVDAMVQVSGPVSVTIGDGDSNGARGDPTHFGDLLTARGGDMAGQANCGFGAGGPPVTIGSMQFGGVGVIAPLLGPVGGGGSDRAHSTVPHRDYGGGYATQAAPNKGGGGAKASGSYYQRGGSGCCVVEWWE